jgi:phytoene dehydrogenase-like protein
MEKVREILGNVAITINSGYRSPDVNRKVGGTSNSSHTYGYAVDFTAYGHTPLTISNILSKSNLKFDQLIYEKTWVHISFDPRMRGNILTLKGKGKYVKGIV